MRIHSSLVLISSIALIAACGETTDDGGGNGGGGGGGGNDAPDAGGGGGGGDEFEILASGEWSLEAGTEDYLCIYYTLPETVWVEAFRPLIPLGTHHTVVTKGAPQQPDGIVPCGAETNYTTMVFGSGVGTDELHFPDGVAMKIEKGEQLLINLHLFNISDQALTGVSGTEIIRVDESEVEQEAEALMVAEFGINLPPKQETTVEGSCTMNADTNIFSVQPHMHMLGTHMKVIADSSVDGTVPLLDQDYSFDEQTMHMMDPVVAMKAGDRVRIECTYYNSTDRTVGWGDSSYDEMCISAVYRYPASGALFFCSDSF